ncbi:hypothetical protein [Phormidium tenue]|uniref:LPS biosynthesis glycosyltransferase n=1 Tax=Phormidium tenue NIES-30 TaxID=549789 RepID=A0A1U7J2U3_9CYAN|nr:hypothetical protein [Phormidium tenue]MBD2231894.1 hypothetical protein [Phormidium tenue FACHB-1052]OKH46449.1 hypothetical protein NIES30_17305 [Phormidium tenue NIES-30]
MKFTDYFDRIAIVYLPERKRRFRSIQRQVRRLGIEDKVQWFQGLKFDDAGQFPKASVRGCVMSNYELLRQAADDNVERLLLFQEDCVLSQRLICQESAILEELTDRSWDFAYFGCQPYSNDMANGKKTTLNPTPDRFFSQVKVRQNIRETHFWTCQGRAIPKLVEFMEASFDRPMNHPDYGPMYFDGYMNEIRYRNPNLVTLAAVPSLGWPLSSVSNLNPGRLDHIPGVSSALQVVRGTKNFYLETADFVQHSLMPSGQQVN